MEIGLVDRDYMSAQGWRIRETLPALTNKQHEVLALVAENRTSKEIAWELGISESAVNQRIEGVRNRTGSPPRAELARAYRQYLQEAGQGGGAGDEAGFIAEACNPLPEKIPQVPETAIFAELPSRDNPDERLLLSDRMTFRVEAPWQAGADVRIVPEVLDGSNAGLNRVAAMVLIAGGLLLVAIFGLDLARSLSGAL